MRKLVITFILFVFCAVCAMAAADIQRPGNLLLNPAFDEGGTTPDDWQMESGISDGFAYSAGRLTFSAPGAGSATPAYVYQDVTLDDPAGKVFTVGLAADVTDAVRRYWLTDKNITVQIQWFGDTACTQLLKTEWVKGLLPYNLIPLNGSVSAKDYFLEQKVYCPFDSRIKACRFGIYVEKRMIVQNIRFTNAWMYDEGYAKHYVTSTNTLKATGNTIEPVIRTDGIELLYFDSFCYLPWNEIHHYECFPVMSPDTVDTSSVVHIIETGHQQTSFQNSPFGKNEKLCVEAFVYNDTNLYADSFITDTARTYFRTAEQGKPAIGCPLQNKYFKNRAGSFGTLYGVVINGELKNSLSSVLTSTDISLPCQLLDTAGTDVILTSLNDVEAVSGAKSSVFDKSFAKYCPNTNVIFDVSNYGPTSGRSGYDLLNTLQFAENSYPEGGDKAYKVMGFLVNDRLSPANLEETQYLRDKLYEADGRLAVGSKVSPVTDLDIKELPYYSRAAGDILFADILPADGSCCWAPGEKLSDNIIVKNLDKFTCPVFGIVPVLKEKTYEADLAVIGPRRILDLMYQGRDLSGMLFVTDYAPDLQSSPIQRTFTIPAAMIIKDRILHNDISLVPGFCHENSFEKIVLAPEQFTTDEGYLCNVNTKYNYVCYCGSSKEEVWVIQRSSGTSGACVLGPLSAGCSADIYSLDTDSLTETHLGEGESFTVPDNKLYVIYVHK